MENNGPSRVTLKWLRSEDGFQFVDPEVCQQSLAMRRAIGGENSPA